VLQDGHPIGDALDRYLESRTDLQPGTLTTLRHRLGAFIDGRRHLPVEGFPWAKAWGPLTTTAKDTQLGVLSALRGFVAHLKDPGASPRGRVGHPQAEGQEEARQAAGPDR
jgi:hypothetical protein